MNLTNNILGCHSSLTRNPKFSIQENENFANKFCSYIYGVKGIYECIHKLERENYGNDMNLILFQFSVNPIPYELPYLKMIENYRKKEKSIGGWIIINEVNFFNKSEEDRYDFIKESIMQKMDLVEEVVKKKKLDTNMELLKEDLKAVLEQWQPE
jgi:hypothetical protein